jgi:cytochrome c oxidase subunit II
VLILILLCSCTVATDSNVISEEDAKKGEELFNKDGCIMCHSISGEIKYGPALNNIFNKAENVIRSGDSETIIVDRKYLIRSLVEPEYQKVSSFRKKKMTKPEISLEDINHIVDYLIYINTHPQKK